MQLIRRLVHGNTIYVLGGKWPGADEKADEDLSQLTVGAIFFRYGNEEDLGGDNPSTDVTPCHYEAWCVTREVFVAYFGDIASQLLGGNFVIDRDKLAETMQGLIVTRREWPYDKIEFADYEMPAVEALEEIKLRFMEIAGEEEAEDAEDDEAVDDAGEPDVGDQELPAVEDAGGNGQMIQP
jgi:hypothetical protein